MTMAVSVARVVHAMAVQILCRCWEKQVLHMKPASVLLLPPVPVRIRLLQMIHGIVPMTTVVVERLHRQTRTTWFQDWSESRRRFKMDLSFCWHLNIKTISKQMISFWTVQLSSGSVFQLDRAAFLTLSLFSALSKEKYLSNVFLKENF